MATTVKVTTLRVPNLDGENIEEEIDDLEEEIENNIKSKLDDGYTLTGATGGDAFILLIFSKESA